MRNQKRLVYLAIVVAAMGTAGPASAQNRPSPRLQAQGPEARTFRFMAAGSRIGVSIRDVRDADLAAAKMARAEGVVVEAVEVGTPAERAGLKVGDIITEFDGERVRSARHFTRLVQESLAGRAVQLAVNRAGGRHAFSITPEEGRQVPFDLGSLGDLRDRIEGGIGDLMSEGARANVRRLGLSVTPLSSQLATYFGVANGVLVSDVTRDSPAERANVKAGDVITAIGSRRVESATDLLAGVRASTSDTVELTLMRDKRELKLQVKLPEGPRPSTRNSIGI